MKLVMSFTLETGVVLHLMLVPDSHSVHKYI